MKIKINVETTFAMDEKSDIFIFLSNSGGDEIAYEGLTLEQILNDSFSEITDSQERLQMIKKIKKAVKKFYKTLKGWENNLKDAAINE